MRQASWPELTSQAPIQLRVPSCPPVLSPCRTSSLPPRVLSVSGAAVKPWVLGDGRAGGGVGRRCGVHLPGQLTGIAIDRDHPHVVGGDEDLVAVHGDPALGARLLDLGVVAPERHGLRAAADVELHHPAPGVVDVHEAVVDQRGRFFLAAQRAAGRAAADRDHELELEVLGVGVVDVLEARMPRIVVVAVDHQPVLRVVRRIEQALGRNVRGRGWTDDGGKANSSQRADCPQHGILPVGRLTNVLAGEPTTPGGLAGRAGTWQP